MRSAEFGMRNVTMSVARRSTRHCNSTFRIWHSAFDSWFPRSLRHRRHERLQTLGGEFQRLPLLGAHVGRHQELHDLEAVVERELRRLAPQEHAHEMPVL